MELVPVILCGGSGTRLWPISRRGFAKQHVPILGGESPFQRTLRRVAPPGAFARPIVIASSGGRFMVADQAEAMGIDVEIAIEPEGRDTAAAVALAAALVMRRGPDAIAVVLPSDHMVPDAAAFTAAAVRAAHAAAGGALVTFGIRPTGPATGFGYIRPGEEVAPGARRVAAFEEKPTQERAQALIAEGCLWNAGMFCFGAEAGLEEIRHLAPQVAAAVSDGLAEAEDDLGALRVGPGMSAAPRISFDRAVMERTDNALVIEAGFAWSDIGDWRELWALSEKDVDGNVVEGRAIARDSRDSLVRASDGRLVCAIGIEGLVVVDTPDAVLVAPLARAQEVKGLVTALAAQGRPEAETPARVYRPWGWYQTMDLGERFRVKRIQVAPGKKLSLQRHYHRAEHWVVVRGTAEVTRDGEVIVVRENESVFLPQGCLHRLANPGRIPVEIIEVQTGAYLEEDDIVRLEDDFGRG